MRRPTCSEITGTITSGTLTPLRSETGPPISTTVSAKSAPRLVTRTRNVTSFRGAHVGRELFERAVEGGAQASGQAIAGLCRGAPADLVALYDDDPMLAGHGDESRLDALVFSGYRLPIEGVMVHGEWLVADGEHRSGVAARDAFRDAVAAVGAKR